MKELSIEEKAKRYDEAIERGKQIQNTPYTAHWDIMKEVAERLLPELKESKDEKIRKHLITLFTEDYGKNSSARFAGIKVKDILAWLEKQGKHNMGISEATKQELEDNLNKALEKETPESCNEFLEKQGEKKSYVSETMNEKGDFDSGFTRMMENEQKPWSEEDKENFNLICFYLNSPESAGDKYNYLFNWLKSFKDRVQPKQEWSEEDETYLDHIITAIKSYYTDDKGKENPWREELLRWLESLKDRYTWKPSEEQMNVILNLSEWSSVPVQTREVLQTIYNNLKKL